jgi:hypothetical protein
MAFEHKDNSGSIFRNDEVPSANHPTHGGDCKIVCPHCNKSFLMWISGWVNELKNKDGKYFSLKFKDKEERSAPPPPPSPEDLDDDIPF